jgi:very-short-patch-repair endonuclease
VPRTLLDLATLTDDRTLEQAAAAAIYERRYSREHLLRYLADHRGHRGAGRLRRLLMAEDGPSFTRSPPEEILLKLIRASDLPSPRCNVRLGGFELDFYWPEARLAVEVDSWQHHGSRAAMERDRRRDAELAALGIQTLRIPVRDVTSPDRNPVAAIRAAFAARIPD